MIRRALAALSLLVAVAPGLPAQEEEPPATPAPIAVEDGPADAAIADRMGAILGGLDQQGISVGVEAGVVTLAGEVADPAVSEEIGDIATRLDGVVAVRNELTATAELAEQLDPAFSRFRDRIDQAVARLPLLAVAAGLFLAIGVAGLLVARAGVWSRIAPNAFIAAIYRQGVRIVFGLAAFVVALDLLGATALIGTILGAAGIVGLAIGFAVRDTVENFVASVMLSLRQPFRPNDLVEIEGDSGRVIRLTSRATILLSLDGNHIRIPNAVVFKSRIVNYTRSAARRFVFDIGIDPEADLEATRLLAQEAVAALPFVLAEPEALVWIETITEGGVILRVTGWVDQDATGFVMSRSEALRIVKAAIEAAGVSIPDTTYRIRVEGAGDLSLPRTEPAPRRDRSPAPATSEATVQDSEERALMALVAAERRVEDDLLSKDAPQE
jgi:small-conductance mechanosensitive channel